MKRLKKFIMLLALAAVICLPGIVNAAIVESFDSDNAGWKNSFVTDGGVNTLTGSTWNESGGNSGGYISGTVNNASNPNRLYGMQTNISNVFGDLTGKYLTTDFIIDGTVTSSNPLVRFYIGKAVGTTYNYWVTNDAYSWNPNSDTDWTTHTVDMILANFLKWPNQNANSMTFDQVLNNYNDIGLVFADGVDHFTNNSKLGFSSIDGATIGVDNFGAAPVPVPAAVWLLGTGLVGLFGVRRRVVS